MVSPSKEAPDPVAQAMRNKRSQKHTPARDENDERRCERQGRIPLSRTGGAVV
jgi:hypothetical protein